MNLLKMAAENIKDDIGTIGITPTKPETGYGYIKKGEKLGAHFKVEKFVEKPDRETAENYIASEQYVWNSGMYIFKIKTFVAELQKYAPKIYSLLIKHPYEVLIEELGVKAKKITVYPRAKLSLQSHLHRAEHWVVVRGTAKIVNGQKEIFLRENESTFIPAMNRHRLENPGKTNLEIIEVQTGGYLEEDDIIRYDDVYKRDNNI